MDFVTVLLYSFTDSCLQVLRVVIVICEHTAKIHEPCDILLSIVVDLNWLINVIVSK